MIRSLRSYYHTAVTDLRFQSATVLFWRIVIKLLRPFAKLDLQLLFDIDLTQPLEVFPASVECVIEQATEDDIDEILDMQMTRLAPEEAAALSDIEELQYAHLLRARASAHDLYTRSMRAGELCFVARVDGRIGHSNWTRFHDCGEIEGRPVDLLPGEIYTTDAYTQDAMRGKRLHEAVATTMLHFAKMRGCHRAYTITDLTKAGSRRGVRRIGWREMGTILYVTPRGLGRTWLFRLAGDIEPMFRHARKQMETP